MNKIDVSIDSFGAHQIVLGRVGENLATQISIDLSSVLRDYPDATAAVVLIQPKGNVVPISLNLEGKTYIWNVSQAEIGDKAGTGSAQITVADADGTIIKTAIATTKILPSIASGNAPDAVLDWISKAETTRQKLIEAGENANTAAGKIDKMVVNVKDLPSGSAATADFFDDGDKKNLTLGIPMGIQGIQGEKGDKGDAFTYADFTKEELSALTEDISRDAADKAEKAALDAVRLADDAKNAAVIAKENAETSEQNAQIFATKAEMAANNAGWFWLEQKNGTLYYVRSDSLSDDFKLKDDGNGRLVVSYG